MPDARQTARLVLASEDRHELILADRYGVELRRVPAAGYPRFPAWRPGGGLAYLAITSAAAPWQVVVAVLGSDLNLLDVVPSAAVFARPTWSADGSRLMLLCGDSDRAEVVEWLYEDGSTSGKGMRPGLRSAVWGAAGDLLLSVGGSVLSDGEARPLMTLPAARGLAEYGSDDLYVTVDQLAISPQGTLAAVERWYRQGLAPKERVLLIATDGAVRTVQAGRAPSWLPNGDLLLTSSEGAPVRASHIPVRWAGEAIHSACWIGDWD